MMKSPLACIVFQFSHTKPSTHHKYMQTLCVHAFPYARCSENSAENKKQRLSCFCFCLFSTTTHSHFFFSSCGNMPLIYHQSQSPPQTCVILINIILFCKTNYYSTVVTQMISGHFPTTFSCKQHSFDLKIMNLVLQMS